MKSHYFISEILFVNLLFVFLQYFLHSYSFLLHFSSSSLPWSIPFLSFLYQFLFLSSSLPLFLNWLSIICSFFFYQFFFLLCFITFFSLRNILSYFYQSSLYLSSIFSSFFLPSFFFLPYHFLSSSLSLPIFFFFSHLSIPLLPFFYQFLFLLSFINSSSFILYSFSFFFNNSSSFFPSSIPVPLFLNCLFFRLLSILFHKYQILKWIVI